MRFLSYEAYRILARAFLFSNFSSLFDSVDYCISDAIKYFTVCALAQSSGGIARVALHQGKHAALMTTRITLP